MDLAKEVSCLQSYGWEEGVWDFTTAAYATSVAARHHVVAVDYGAKRIGLAVSDAAAEFAFPLTELERRDEKRDREALCTLAAERGVVQLVVGLPLHMDGRAGPEAAAALPVPHPP